MIFFSFCDINVRPPCAFFLTTFNVYTASVSVLIRVFPLVMLQCSGETDKVNKIQLFLPLDMKMSCHARVQGIGNCGLAMEFMACLWFFVRWGFKY